MSQSQSKSPKDGTLLTLTADDLSNAIGAALKAAEKHEGKPAGKKQVALNAAAKSLSGPRSNWGALRARGEAITQAARTHTLGCVQSNAIALNTAEYQPLPDKLCFDEFGLKRFQFTGEAKLRKAFAPAFAAGVSAISIPVHLSLLGSNKNIYRQKLALYGMPSYLDRQLNPITNVDWGTQGAVLSVLERFGKLHAKDKLRELFSTDHDKEKPWLINVTEMGILIVGTPSIAPFTHAFTKLNSNGGFYHPYDNDIYSTYSSIRAHLGPAEFDLDVDEKFKRCLGQQYLPICWLVDPTVTEGATDTGLFRDLILSTYGNHVWGNERYGFAPQTIKALLQHIALKAREPWQESFNKTTFMERHFNWATEENKALVQKNSRPQKKTVFQRLGQLVPF